jgi:hypothetical protein
MRPKASILILTTFARLMLLGSVALAVGGDPQLLFTDNITAPALIHTAYAGAGVDAFMRSFATQCRNAINTAILTQFKHVSYCNYYAVVVS